MGKLVPRTVQFVAAASFIFGGLAMVLEAAPHNVWLLRSGWASVVFGIALLVFSFPIRGEYWWRVLWRRIVHGRLPPTVYLRNTAVKVAHFEDKMFGMQWVETDLSLVFSGDGSLGSIVNTAPRTEKNITLELFNAGESIRHVEARWLLPGVDMREMISVLGTTVQSFDNGILKLEHDKHAAIRPLSTDILSAPIELIDKGAAVKIESPRSFTEAYAICALARARQHHESVMLPALQTEGFGHVQMLENWKSPMDPAIVELRYVKGERICRHAFAVTGWVWGGGQPYVHKPSENSPGLHEAVNGAIACVDNVMVSHHER